MFLIYQGRDSLLRTQSASAAGGTKTIIERLSRSCSTCAEGECSSSRGWNQISTHSAPHRPKYLRIQVSWLRVLSNSLDLRGQSLCPRTASNLPHSIAVMALCMWWSFILSYYPLPYDISCYYLIKYSDPKVAPLGALLLDLAWRNLKTASQGNRSPAYVNFSICCSLGF